MTKTSTTPWGAATVVDELSLQQRAGDKRFASVIQLLDASGEQLVGVWCQCQLELGVAG